MPEQVRFPYGDAFIVGTPHIDQFANRLYAEEQQEKLYRRQQMKSLDDDFSKELAGVKRADIPEVTENYGRYKQAYIGLLKKGNKATPQDHYNVLLERAKVSEGINGSKEDKERLKGYTSTVNGDRKGLFDPEAHTKINKWLNTPTSQRKVDDDNKELSYPYVVPDLDKELKNARGVKADFSVKVGEEGINDKNEIYSKGNTPNQHFDSFLTDLIKNNKGQNFAGIMDHKYDDQQKEDLTNRFLALTNDPKFKAVYGEVKPFNQTALQTRVGQAAALQTMEDFVNMDFSPKKTEVKANQDRAMKARQQFSKEQQARGDFYIRRRQKLTEGFREAFYDYKSDKDEKQNEGVLNKFIDTSKEAGTDKIDGKKIEGVTIDGNKYKGNFVEVPKEIKKEYTVYKGQKNGVDIFVKPDKFFISEDKKTFIPLYLGDKTVTGGNYIKSDSKPVPIQMYKAALAKILLTKKDTGVEVVNDGDLTDNTPPTKTTTTVIHKEQSQERPGTRSLGGDVMIKVNGKVHKGKRSDLIKLDNAKIKYEIIK